MRRSDRRKYEPHNYPLANAGDGKLTYEGIMKISAYRCDVCKGISEEIPKYQFDADERFEASSYKSYQDYRTCACSDECLKVAFSVWVERFGVPEEAPVTADEREALLNHPTLKVEKIAS
jgi:hypothetical protein